MIHRDLKPANIKVSEDGAVKVLDFGLAKAMAPKGVSETDPSESPTITAADYDRTRQGQILGTAAYMSPEQAKGREADRRADIWAFGVCLYEALTGRRAFAGDDVADTLAAVLRAEVDLDALPDETPARLRQVLRVCLQRDPKERAHDIADVRLAMSGAFDTRAQETAAALLVARLQVWQRPVPALILGLSLFVLGGLAVWRLTPPDPKLVARFLIPLAATESWADTGSHLIAISPEILTEKFCSEFWIDPAHDIAGALMTQILPFVDGKVMELFAGAGILSTCLRSRLRVSQYVANHDTNSSIHINRK